MDHATALKKAELLLASGRYGKVTALLLPVCTSSDRDEQEVAYLLLIKAALLEEDSRRAIDFSLKALGARLDTVAVRLCTAWAYQEAELYLEALKHLQVAVRQDPEDSAVQGLLAQIYLNLERYELAEHHGRRAAELAPGESSHLAILAAIQQNTGNPKEALALLDKALAMDPADTNLVSMRATLEKDSEKGIQLFKRVLTSNPQDRQAAREYRQLTRRRINRSDGLLFGAYTLLSLSLVLFPQLTEVSEPRIYFWLYLPGAWVLGRNWRLGLPFFLLSFGLLSQVKSVSFSHWTPFGVVFMSLSFTLKFWFLHILADLWANRTRNSIESFRLHRRQGTMKTKLMEMLDEMLHLDSALVLLGSASICLATLKWLPDWIGWGVFLPLLIQVKYRGRKGWSFYIVLAPLFYGDMAIFMVTRFAAPSVSVVSVILLMLLQLYLVHHMYLRKVRYAYAG